MKTINWRARRAATPASCTCPWCERDNIVVDRVTGLRVKHRIKPKTQPGQKHPWCEGSGKLHTTTPGGPT